MLQNVDRSRIAVELGSKSEAHAAAGSQIRDLFVGKGLYGTLLQARMWRGGRVLLLREGRAGYHHDEERDDARRRGINGAPHPC
jgi:hypothetical protein